MYNGPIYNRRGQKIGELRSSALANPFACLFVALIPVGIVVTIISFIGWGVVSLANGINTSLRNNDVNNAIEGGATHSFSEGRTTGNVLVSSSGYGDWLGNEGASVTFDINAHVAGSYNLTVYSGGPGDMTTVDVSVNGGSPTTMDMSPDDTGSNVTTSPIAISLQAGQNTITFSHQTYGTAMSSSDECNEQQQSNCGFLDKITLS